MPRQMQIIRGLHNIRTEHHGCVATIGNFDGVHLGHQAVFRHLLEQGEALGLPSTIITFEPQPQEFFCPARAPARLTRLREKMTALREMGIDRMVILEFNARLARMPARQFVQNLLIDGLGVHSLYVGDDFRFGTERQGDFALLQEMGGANGFEVANLHTFEVEADRVSSTRIRELLVQGDFAAAAQCLGRPYQICGRVVHGDERGRTIGFPTANIDLHRQVSPLRGVYVVKVYGLPEGLVGGVANIGTRPTISGSPHCLLEVHLFDFARSIYGEHLQVEFCHKLRDEVRFKSFGKLKQQIERDAQQARDFLNLIE